MGAQPPLANGLVEREARRHGCPDSARNGHTHFMPAGLELGGLPESRKADQSVVRPIAAGFGSQSAARSVGAATPGFRSGTAAGETCQTSSTPTEVPC